MGISHWKRLNRCESSARLSSSLDDVIAYHCASSVCWISIEKDGPSKIVCKISILLSPSELLLPTASLLNQTVLTKICTDSILSYYQSGP
jgi:hypothetical protein